MPATVRSEFSLALNQVATERGLDPKIVLETIQAAILAAYRKDYPTDEIDTLTATIDPDTGEAKIVKEGKDVTPPGFGRIAAQTAKQVILQRIREEEKQAVLTDYQTKIGMIVPGMVLRFDGPNIVVDIGRTQAVMPVSEQNPGERYHLNQRLTFYIEGIRETPRGNEIIVSRSHKGLVEGLFHREVPEVAQGAVELRIVVREAGGRTKIAVFSKQSGVDPVGSCVGQKGVRVTAVINELGGNEKVDIIQWSDQPKAFITAALAPAKDIDVALNEEEKEATVTVPEDQLSLAIGRDGQNVRLAAKLTGWKIDIQGKPVVGKEEVSTDKPKEEIQVSPDQPIVEVKEPEKQEVVKEEKVEPVQEASVEVVVETPKTETVQADTTPSV
ncbi:MAG: NusA antitermination factor [Microgenomates group bacterium GW2011_GWB1_40_9]|nr:MAG: NusA antitermination factor [Microgenomates group bacterium GW2011_GWB1_40_9]